MKNKPLSWHTEQRRVNDLLPNPKNPRELDDRQRDALMKSLKQFGLAEIPAINTDNQILAGHQRIKVLQLLGRGEEMIDVRIPSRPLTKKEADTYLLTSNAVHGSWSFDLLREFPSDLLLDIGFDPAELNDVFDNILATEDDHFDVEKEIKKIKKPTVLPGELYALGNHRLIDALKREIEQESGVEYVSRGKEMATVFSFGSFTFTEQVRDVLAVLEKAGQVYSKEDLIAQLQTEAERLGRTPGIREINQSSSIGRTASSITFARAFGSWNAALKAAGLKVNMTKDYSKEDLIAQLQTEAERLGRTPRSMDIPRASKAGRTASLHTFTIFFGSFDEALIAAGFTIDPMKDYSRETLIAQLKAEGKRLGKTPSIPSINASSKARRTVSVQTFVKIFGSWGDALGAAGFTVNVFRADKSSLIAQLKKEAKRLGKNPTSLDINASSQAGRTASTTTFLRAFGSWGDVLNAAGLKASQNYDKSTLIAQLQAEAKRLGRVPMALDIIDSSKAGRTASTATFRTFFGSWENSLKAAGLAVHRVRRDKAALIAQLKKEAKRLGRPPSMSDIELLSEEGKMAKLGTFLGEFGSWTKALVAAGLRTNAVRRYPKDVLIAQLKAEAEQSGLTPTMPHVDAMSKQGKMASSASFVGAFGSWGNALAAIGLESNVKRYTPDILIAQLKKEAKRLRKSPNAKDIRAASAAGRTASPSKFAHAFGSHNRALEAAGLKLNKK